ncbi:hypothetical protein Dda_6936 [Drechslerella dactyloides]|uniref:PNPLA domain-containing protein n=1 Tax=Drechslerella dactyloides TaxID=74499 RepID=A0AAD6NH35_DREDA|nr:hypothetical protein Dda_6936 [Drechslerella dactyloides]
MACAPTELFNGYLEQLSGDFIDRIAPDLTVERPSSSSAVVTDQTLRALSDLLEPAGLSLEALGLPQYRLACESSEAERFSSEAVEYYGTLVVSIESSLTPDQSSVFHWNGVVLKATYGENRAMLDWSYANEMGSKVGVSVTSVSRSAARILCDYSGSAKTREYSRIRSERDIHMWEAGRCTSAAPWYFKPHTIPGVDTLEDGGMSRNNPVDIAESEARGLWGPPASIDAVLSLGTGTTAQTGETCPSTTWSQSRPPPEISHKYHHLNPVLGGKEPPLDNIKMMGWLRTWLWKSNCYDQAVSSNVCADDSWVLYERGSRGNAFCCANGQVGRSTTGNNGRAICVNPGTPVGRNDAELNVQPQGSRDLLLASRSSGAPATSTPAPGGSSSSMSEEPTVSAPGGSPSVPPSSDVPRQTSTGTDSMDISSPAGTSMTSTGANPTETTSAGSGGSAGVEKDVVVLALPRDVDVIVLGAGMVVGSDEETLTCEPVIGGISAARS